MSSTVEVPQMMFSNAVLEVIGNICFTCGKRFDTIDAKVQYMKEVHLFGSDAKICRVCYSLSKIPMVHTHQVLKDFLYVFCLFSLKSSYFWFLLYFLGPISFETSFWMWNNGSTGNLVVIQLYFSWWGG